MVVVGLTPVWVLPVQIAATMAPCINFGGSVLHSPLVMPLLQLPSIPTAHLARQNAKLLDDSEAYFPRLSIVSTLSNAVLLVSALVLRSSSSSRALLIPAWARKWPIYGAALLCNMATTFYALRIMVPHNEKIKKLAKRLEKEGGEDSEASRAELRKLQDWWIRGNYARAVWMIAGGCFSMYALTS